MRSIKEMATSCSENPILLENKDLSPEKRQSIISSLETLLRNENNNKATNGESCLKRCFSEIVDSLGIYYKIGLSTDLPVNCSMKCIAGWVSRKTN